VAKRETTRGTSVRINGGRDFRLASVPVLVVGPEVLIDPQAEVRVERILYATDLLPESRRAMRYAYALAKHYGLAAGARKARHGQKQRREWSICSRLMRTDDRELKLCFMVVNPNFLGG
jgi:hypothetical protein